MERMMSSTPTLTPNVLFAAIKAVADAIGPKCEAHMMRAVAAASASDVVDAPATQTLRDTLAGAALQGLFSGGKVSEVTSDALLAKWAYAMADAMIDARGGDAAARPSLIQTQLIIALRDCVSVMERELNGLAVIQPELRQAHAALASAGAA